MISPPGGAIIPPMRTWLPALALALSAPALGDTLVLRDGGKLEGTIEGTTKEGEKEYYTLRLPFGTTKVEAERVAEVIRAPSVLEEYRARRAALTDGDAQGFLALARFCRERRLYPEMEKTYRELLAFSPDDPEARATLGYVRKDGRWVTESEHRREEGFVSFEGMWITPASLATLLEERQEAQALAHQRREEAAQREAEQRRRDAAEREALRRPVVLPDTAPTDAPPPSLPAPGAGMILRPGQNRNTLDDRVSIGYTSRPIETQRQIQDIQNLYGGNTKIGELPPPPPK